MQQAEARLIQVLLGFFRRSDQKVNSIASHNTILDEGIWFNSTKFFTTEIARNAWQILHMGLIFSSKVKG